MDIKGLFDNWFFFLYKFYIYQRNTIKSDVTF
jgi:hypothetical protein